MSHIQIIFSHRISQIIVYLHRSIISILFIRDITKSLHIMTLGKNKVGISRCQDMSTYLKRKALILYISLVELGFSYYFLQTLNLLRQHFNAASPKLVPSSLSHSILALD